jgi:predicted transcriptional regulator
MNLREKKQTRLQVLLTELKTREMNRHEMGEFLGVSIKVISHYITQLKYSKSIHISRYETNCVGSYIVYYMEGNKKNAARRIHSKTQSKNRLVS